MRVIIILLSVLASPSVLAVDKQPIMEVTQKFYAWVLTHPGVSLPSGQERTELAQYLSPNLIHLLAAASETESRCIKAAPPGEKPNLFEGSLLVGNYEGASEVSYGAIHRKGSVAHILAALVYVDERFPKAHPYRTHAWSDKIELRITGEQWLIYDIKFQQRKSLSSVLVKYIAEGKHGCIVP